MDAECAMSKVAFPITTYLQFNGMSKSTKGHNGGVGNHEGDAKITDDAWNGAFALHGDDRAVHQLLAAVLQICSRRGGFRSGEHFGIRDVCSGVAHAQPHLQRLSSGAAACR